MSDLLLSARIGRIAGVFEAHAHKGLHWDPLSAGQFASAVRLLEECARRLEAEIDRLRWDNARLRDPARNAPDVMAQALAEIERMIQQGPATGAPAPDDLILAGVADGTVTLFPTVKRPAFCDGGEPHGGAA